MSRSLQPDALLRSVGQKVKNSQGKPIGKIVEVISDENTHEIQYLILQSYIFYGIRERYFAVPASSLLLKIDDKGENVILKISIDDLVLAKGTSADHYPKPHLETGQPIFELYNYHRKDDSELNT